MRFLGRAILLDIEGTTSSISFVHDVMFPYARRELACYLDENWESDGLRDARELIARDVGHESFAAWCGKLTREAAISQVSEAVLRWMDDDVKATGLKQLQGLIWKDGFDSGELRAHVYDDVPPSIESWNANGLDVRIYSSGSIAAQKLFFGHTIAGDLLHYFRGHYDTTTGSKTDLASYRQIASDFDLPAEDILFLSDVPAELDAACQTGFQTALCIRPGNDRAKSDRGHQAIQSFRDVQIQV